MNSIAKCNECGFVYKYTQKPAKIRCKACGSNKSLSVRQGMDVLNLLRVLVGKSCIDYHNAWGRVA